MSETERGPGPTEFAPLLVVLDERLSRDRALWLTRLVKQVRTFAQAELLRSDTTDEVLRARMDADPTLKLALPWDRLEKSGKLDYGNRVAGYTCEPLPRIKLEQSLAQGPTRLQTHCAFWDWSPQAKLSSLSAPVVQLRLWLHARWASGLRGWLGSAAPIWVEHWGAGQGLGSRLDQISAIPELQAPAWRARLPSLRNALCALWSIVYEQGPGLPTSSYRGAAGAVASLQIATTETLLALRLCTHTPQRNGNDALKGYLPGSERASEAKQMLFQFADFARIQWIKDAGGLEITLLLWGDTEPDSYRARAFWLGTLSASQIVEAPFESPSPEIPQFRVLPPPATPGVAATLAAVPTTVGAAARHPEESPELIKDLRRQLAQRDALLSELKAGGVGAAKPLPPPDTEALIEAFQTRYFEAKLRIRELEAQLHQIETRGGKTDEIAQLRNRIAAIAAREKLWIQRIGSAIETARAAGGRKR